MINDDKLIKVERARGHKTDWPEIVIQMKERMKEMKLGFPGIGNDHMSLITFSELQEGDLFIWDMYSESMTRGGDEAPLLLVVLPDGKAKIEGIGCGIDSKRDPDRIKYRWMDVIDMPKINPNHLVFKIDVRPSLNGGPGYYYFFKSYRDFRY